MNRYLSILIVAALCAFSTVASANKAFWDAIAEKRYDDALAILERDPTVDVNWIPHPGANTAASMVGVPGDEYRPLLTAIWIKKNGGASEFTSDYMKKFVAPGSEKLAKAAFATGFESDETGMRFLHWLCYEGHTELIHYYVDRLEDPSLLNTAVDVVGDVILHSLIFGERDLSEAKDPWHRRLVKYLVGQGANVNAPGEHGKTPLILAAEMGLTRMVTTLVKLQANVHAVDSNGETALLHAARNGHERVVAILLKAGANASTASLTGALPLLEAVANGYHKVVAMLLDNGVDVRATDAQGNTVLHLVPAKFSHTAKLLIERGARVDAVNLAGDTPLHIAATQNHRAIAHVLVENGAAIDVENRDGKTPAQGTTNKILKKFLDEETEKGPKGSPKRGREPSEAEIEEADKRGRLGEEQEVQPMEVVEAPMVEVEPVVAVPALTVEQMLQEIGNGLGDVGLFMFLTGLKHGKNFHKG